MVFKTDDTHLLVSLSNSKGQNFILKLSVQSNVLKVLVTDKTTAEKWKCAYDASYIENLTRKTGNFKQFMVFVSMLKAGLLKTNECVYIELLSQDELESRRKKGSAALTPSSKNRRYLILVYQVEFDKIHYPLPLEYCGKPDPDVLQSTIKKLETVVLQTKCDMSKQMARFKSEVESRESSFQSLIAQLNNENKSLYEENNRLKKQLAERDDVELTNRMIRKMETELKLDKIAYTDKIYRLEIENKKLSSLLMGRASRSRIPVKIHSDSTFNRTTSLPRSNSSLLVYDTEDQRYRSKKNSKKSPSPTRKSSCSSSERSDKSNSMRKSKTNVVKRKTSSSDRLSSQERKNNSQRNQDKNKHKEGKSFRKNYKS
ncbi:centrosomal protein CCDC61 [Halyomorpha halys]|uniref:centrosomal protein CCDC61 n=1 Tax=Halyomorpha halys TaxID=286706 RepID=UPI0006D4E008|nr:coiled-coil domain-containing protein 61 [Halyomorpha halys]